MKRLVVAILAIVSLALAGTALGSTPLRGKYKTVIKNSTVLGGQLNGTWRITFTKGHYLVTQNRHFVVRGTDRILKGNVIKVKDSPGPSACPAVGKYKYNLAGKTLTFKRISDSTSILCRGRVDVLKHKFTKV